MFKSNFPLNQKKIKTLFDVSLIVIEKFVFFIKKKKNNLYIKEENRYNIFAMCIFVHIQYLLYI